MFRSNNPFNAVLAESNCLFYFTGGQEFSVPVIAGGLPVKKIQGEPSAYIYSHGAGDAFSGLHFFGRLQYRLSNPVENQIADFPEKVIVHGDFTLVHKVMRRVYTPVGVTFTQNLIASITAAVPSLSSLSLVVAIDPIENLTADTELGNSLIITSFSKEKIKKLARVAPGEWRQALRRRADAVLEYIAVAGTSALAKPSNVLVSSLGRLDRLPYVDERYLPESFIMAPTPIYRDCINMITWSYYDAQVLTLCFFTDDYASAPLAQKLTAAWKESLRAA